MNQIARIERQGCIDVNSCSVLFDADGVVVLEIDLKSKYAILESTGGGSAGPSVHIGATERTLYLRDGFGLEDTTEILFPRWVGYSVWASDVARYSCTVCLVDMTTVYAKDSTWFE